nr:MAG TPA: hypothetical protein [Caudoviricetes sp.]
MNLPAVPGFPCTVPNAKKKHIPASNRRTERTWRCT